MKRSINFRKGYPDSLDKNQLMSGDVAVLTGQATKIAEMTVARGLAVALGRGVNTESLVDAVGRLFMELKNAADASIKGKIKIEIRTPDDNHSKTLYQNRLENLDSTFHGANIVKDLMEPWPERNEVITEDNRIAIYLISDTDETVSKANSTMYIDATKYPVETVI